MQQICFNAYFPSHRCYSGVILGPRHKQFHVKLFQFSFRFKKGINSELFGTARRGKIVYFSLQMFVEIYFYKNTFIQSWQTSELLSGMKNLLVQCMFLHAVIKNFELGTSLRIRNQAVTVCVLMIFKFALAITYCQQGQGMLQNVFSYLSQQGCQTRQTSVM